MTNTGRGREHKPQQQPALKGRARFSVRPAFGAHAPPSGSARAAWSSAARPVPSQAGSAHLVHILALLALAVLAVVKAACRAARLGVRV